MFCVVCLRQFEDRCDTCPSVPNVPPGFLPSTRSLIEIEKRQFLLDALALWVHKGLVSPRLRKELSMPYLTQLHFIRPRIWSDLPAPTEAWLRREVGENAPFPSIKITINEPQRRVPPLPPAPPPLAVIKPPQVRVRPSSLRPSSDERLLSVRTTPPPGIAVEVSETLETPYTNVPPPIPSTLKESNIPRLYVRALESQQAIPVRNKSFGASAEEELPFVLTPPARPALEADLFIESNDALDEIGDMDTLEEVEAISSLDRPNDIQALLPNIKPSSLRPRTRQPTPREEAITLEVEKIKPNTHHELDAPLHELDPPKSASLRMPKHAYKTTPSATDSQPLHELDLPAKTTLKEAQEQRDAHALTEQEVAEQEVAEQEVAGEVSEHVSVRLENVASEEELEAPKEEAETPSEELEEPLESAETQETAQEEAADVDALGDVMGSVVGGDLLDVVPSFEEGQRSAPAHSEVLEHSTWSRYLKPFLTQYWLYFVGMFLVLASGFYLLSLAWTGLGQVMRQVVIWSGLCLGAGSFAGAGSLVVRRLELEQAGKLFWLVGVGLLGPAGIALGKLLPDAPLLASGLWAASLAGGWGFSRYWRPRVSKQAGSFAWGTWGVLFSSLVFVPSLGGIATILACYLGAWLLLQQIRAVPWFQSARKRRWTRWFELSFEGEREKPDFWEHFFFLLPGVYLFMLMVAWLIWGGLLHGSLDPAMWWNGPWRWFGPLGVMLGWCMMAFAEVSEVGATDTKQTYSVWLVWALLLGAAGCVISIQAPFVLAVAAAGYVLLTLSIAWTWPKKAFFWLAGVATFVAHLGLVMGLNVSFFGGASLSHQWTGIWLLPYLVALFGGVQWLKRHGREEGKQVWEQLWLVVSIAGVMWLLLGTQWLLKIWLLVVPVYIGAYFALCALFARKSVGYLALATLATWVFFGFVYVHNTVQVAGAVASLLVLFLCWSGARWLESQRAFRSLQEVLDDAMALGIPVLLLWGSHPLLVGWIGKGAVAPSSLWIVADIALLVYGGLLLWLSLATGRRGWTYVGLGVFALGSVLLKSELPHWLGLTIRPWLSNVVLFAVALLLFELALTWDAKSRELDDRLGLLWLGKRLGPPSYLLYMPLVQTSCVVTLVGLVQLHLITLPWMIAAVSWLLACSFFVRVGTALPSRAFGVVFVGVYFLGVTQLSYLWNEGRLLSLLGWGEVWLFATLVLVCGVFLFERLVRGMVPQILVAPVGSERTLPPSGPVRGEFLYWSEWMSPIANLMPLIALVLFVGWLGVLAGYWGDAPSVQGMMWSSVMWVEFALVFGVLAVLFGQRWFVVLMASALFGVVSALSTLFVASWESWIVVSCALVFGYGVGRHRGWRAFESLGYLPGLWDGWRDTSTARGDMLWGKGLRDAALLNSFGVMVWAIHSWLMYPVSVGWLTLAGVLCGVPFMWGAVRRQALPGARAQYSLGWACWGFSLWALGMDGFVYFSLPVPPLQGAALSLIGALLVLLFAKIVWLERRAVLWDAIVKGELDIFSPSAAWKDMDKADEVLLWQSWQQWMEIGYVAAAGLVFVEWMWGRQPLMELPFFLMLPLLVQLIVRPSRVVFSITVALGALFWWTNALPSGWLVGDLLLPPGAAALLAWMTAVLFVLRGWTRWVDSDEPTEGRLTQDWMLAALLLFGAGCMAAALDVIFILDLKLWPFHGWVLGLLAASGCYYVAMSWSQLQGASLLSSDWEKRFAHVGAFSSTPGTRSQWELLGETLKVAFAFSTLAVCILLLVGMRYQGAILEHLPWLSLLPFAAVQLQRPSRAYAVLVVIGSLAFWLLGLLEAWIAASLMVGASVVFLWQAWSLWRLDVRAFEFMRPWTLGAFGASLAICVWSYLPILSLWGYTLEHWALAAWAAILCAAFYRGLMLCLGMFLRREDRDVPWGGFASVEMTQTPWKLLWDTSWYGFLYVGLLGSGLALKVCVEAFPDTLDVWLIFAAASVFLFDVSRTPNKASISISSGLLVLFVYVQASLVTETELFISLPAMLLVGGLWFVLEGLGAIVRRDGQLLRQRRKVAFRQSSFVVVLSLLTVLCFGVWLWWGLEPVFSTFSWSFHEALWVLYAAPLFFLLIVLRFGVQWRVQILLLSWWIWPLMLGSWSVEEGGYTMLHAPFFWGVYVLLFGALWAFVVKYAVSWGAEGVWPHRWFTHTMWRGVNVETDSSEEQIHRCPKREEWSFLQRRVDDILLTGGALLRCVWWAAMVSLSWMMWRVMSGQSPPLEGVWVALMCVLGLGLAGRFVLRRASWWFAWFVALSLVLYFVTYALAPSIQDVSYPYLSSFALWAGACVLCGMWLSAQLTDGRGRDWWYPPVWRADREGGDDLSRWSGWHRIPRRMERATLIASFWMAVLASVAIVTDIWMREIVQREAMWLERVFVPLALVLLAWGWGWLARRWKSELLAYFAIGCFFGLYAHMRISWGFGSDSLDGWMMFVFGFVFIGFRMVWQKLGGVVLARAIQRVVFVLPWVAFVFAWLGQGSFPSAMWMVSGLYYGVLAYRSGRRWLYVPAFAFANVEIMMWLSGRGALSWHWFVLPVGLTLASFAVIFQEDLSERGRTSLRVVGSIAIYVSSASQIIVGHSIWDVMVLAILSIAGILLGIALQLRSYLLFGVVFLFLDVIIHLFYLGTRDRVVGMIFLFVVGVLFLVTAVFFHLKRDALLARVKELRETLDSWEV